MALQAQVQDPACVRMGFMAGNEPHARAGFYWPRRKRAASLWSCGCMWAGKVWEGARAHARVGAATRPHPLLRRRLDRRRTWGAERPHWDSAHPCDICARSRTTPATSARELCARCRTFWHAARSWRRLRRSATAQVLRRLLTPPHRHRDWAHPCHIGTGTGLTPATSAPGLGSPLPHCAGTACLQASPLRPPRQRPRSR
jgi:hypothetical protein